MTKIESGMSRDDLLHLLVSGEEACWMRNLVSVINLRPESGVKDIRHWLVTLRKKDHQREVYIKTI